MSIEHWWSDADRRKPKYSEKNLSQRQSVTTKPTLTGLESNFSGESHQQKMCFW